MSEVVTIDVRYSCPACGLQNVTAKVPVREAGSDVVVWMKEILGAALSRDHDQRSPGCHPTGLTDVYIPVAGADHIGGPVVQ